MNVDQGSQIFNSVLPLLRMFLFCFYAFCFLPACRVSMLYVFSHPVVSESFATPWTVAHQAPLSTGFFRQEYWSGLPNSSPGYLTDPGIEP